MADGIEFAPAMKLLKLKEFVGCKVFKVGALQGVIARRSQIPENNWVRRFLVYGKFQLAEGDPGGYDHIWMTPDEVMDSENVSEDEID